MEAARTAGDLTIGETSSISHVVTEADLAMFAGATGDVNPIHFDDAYAAKTFFKGRIAHGMLSAGFISAVIANRLPGVSTVYVTQSLRFLGPVRIGDTVTAEVEVLEVDTAKNRVKLRTTCTNQSGVVVVDGEAVVMPPKRTTEITEDPGLGDRLAEVEGRIAAGERAFLAAFRGEDLEAPARGDEIPGDAASLWGEQLERWLGTFSVYQGQMERLMSAWVDQTAAVQKESQKVVQDWMLSMHQGGAGICTAWKKNFDQAGKLLGLQFPEKSRVS